MAVVPVAPSGAVTPATLGTLLNVKDGDEQQRVFDLAVETVNRELGGAYRDVPVIVYDDLVRKVAGAIVGSKRRPAGGNGQLTRAEQDAPSPATPRDYAAPIRTELALYVVPL